MGPVTNEDQLCLPSNEPVRSAWLSVLCCQSLAHLGSEALGWVGCCPLRKAGRKVHLSPAGREGGCGKKRAEI
jgi:hypothetical protein